MKKKGLKKVLLIICMVILILLLALIGVAVWQKDNIKAFVLSRRYSSEEIIEQISEIDNQLKQEIEKYFPDGIREYTEEEKEEIKSGKTSEKQVLAKILSEKNEELEAKENMTEEELKIYENIVEIQKKLDPNITVKKDTSEIVVPKPIEKKSNSEINVVGEKSQTGSSNSKPNSANKGNTVTAESIISKYVSELYMLESKYISAIEGIVASAKSEAKSKGLTKKDTSQLLSIGAKYTGNINSLEASCDAEVENVITNLTRDLNRLGADTSIISTIRTAYANEKSLKRAYYMNMVY